MKILMHRVQNEWPVWLAVSFIALLPFRRLAEIPLSIFAISLLFLLRSDEHKARIKTLLPLLLPLFLCFWIPMVVSSFDSYAPQKSWVTSSGSGEVFHGGDECRRVAAFSLDALAGFAVVFLPADILGN